MKRYCHLIVIAMLSLLATGCWMYKPQLADVPLIEHKGDVRIAGSLYVVPATGISATVSTGLTDRTSLPLSFSMGMNITL